MSDDATVHLFYIRSGFEYFFSLQLIEHLGLDDVLFVMSDPREGIERRASQRYRVIHGRRGRLTKLLGKKIGKLLFARRVLREGALTGKRIALYSPVYNETCVFALRDGMERAGSEVHCFLIPDGAALLRHLPRKEKPPGLLVRWLNRRYRAEPADRRHTSGSYSPFIEKVYHFPAKKIHAEAAKIEIVPVPTSDRGHNGEVLVVGALGGVTRAFVRAAVEVAGGSPVRFRMHPRNRDGLEFIREEAPGWKELASLDGSLEEHMLAHPYRVVLGSYSTALMFNHLFVAASQSMFLIDAEGEDPDWRETAEACEIPIRDIEDAASRGGEARERAAAT